MTIPNKLTSNISPCTTPRPRSSSDAAFFRKSERPDFVSPRGDTGLEVTRAAIEEWVRQEANLSRNFGAGSSPADHDRARACARNAKTTPATRDGQDVDDSGPLGLSPREKAVHTTRILERIYGENKPAADLPGAFRSQLALRIRRNDGPQPTRTCARWGEAILRLPAGKPAIRAGVRIKIGCGLYAFDGQGEMSEYRLTTLDMLLRVHRKANTARELRETGGKGNEPRTITSDLRPNGFGPDGSCNQIKREQPNRRRSAGRNTTFSVCRLLHMPSASARHRANSIRRNEADGQRDKPRQDEQVVQIPQHGNEVRDEVYRSESAYRIVNAGDDFRNQPGSLFS